IVNHTPENSPWPYVPKVGPAGHFPKGAFFEGGINVAALLNGNICFSSFLLSTRASQSLDAELKDFIGGTFPIAPQVTVNSQTVCPNGSATLNATVTGSQAPFTYLWSTGATTTSITVSPAATAVYTVTVTGANGCTGTASGTVTIASALPCSIGNLNPANLLCNTGAYSISSLASAATYSWTMTVDGSPPGWGIVGSANAQTLIFTSGFCGAPGFQVHFTLTVTDANNCTNTCTVSFAPGAPQCVVDIQPPVNLNCVNTSQYLLASYNSDFPNAMFMWSRNNVQLGAGINDTINGLDSILITQAGTYRFSITNPFNTSDSCFAEVIVNQDTALPNITATGDSITCQDSTAQLSASSSTAGA
ncbi:MAG TPA: hypothetical protein VKH37_09200, partial [Ferruginibacter sp.]|nr:hypothetical protein [Ferruginibacter sp.]